MERRSIRDTLISHIGPPCLLGGLETYLVHANECEDVYDNMPTFDLPAPAERSPSQNR